MSSHRIEYRFAATLVAFLLAGCAGRDVRPLEAIRSVDDFCVRGAAKGPALMSIVSSIGDLPPSGAPLNAANVVATIKRQGGVVAHWSDLNLLLPQTAKAFRASDSYLHVRAAAFTNPAPDASRRPVQLLIAAFGHRDRWYAFHAYDVQNVCVEGSVKI